MKEAEVIQSANLIGTEHIMLLILGGVLLILALFAVFAVFISIINYEEKPVRDRLLMLKEKQNYELLGKRKAGAFDDLKEALITFAGPMSKALYGQKKTYLQQVKNRLTEAGLQDNEDQIMRFLARRAAAGLVASGLGFVIGLPFIAAMKVAPLGGLVGGFLLGSYVPEFMLRMQAGKRKTEIRYTLPDTLDLMVVCVEAGLGLDSTIQRVSEETEQMAPEISHEFKRLNKELNAGISRIEAFQNMGSRAGVDELRSLCAMIVQADKMGTSVADTLRVYADDLRTKRRQRAEELASKASIKMTFPLVLFIFPPLFIILMGPIVINTIQNFFH